MRRSGHMKGLVQIVCSVAFQMSKRKHTVTHSDSSSTTEICDSKTGNEVKVKGKPGFRVNGLVEGAPLEWKIDTGAVNTFITEDLYYSILPGNRPVLEPVLKKFATADGSEL